MIDKPLEKISEGDIQWLIERKIPEMKTIEYKVAFALGSDSDRKEFLADVSSFANSIGGDLIFGVRAQDGEPQEIVGLTEKNIDSLKLQLEGLIKDGIKPRIPGLEIKEITTSKGVVIFIRIPDSFCSPHVVTLKNSFKFYSRNSAGKFQLDVDELRNAFLFSDALNEKIKNFRFSRLTEIISGDSHLQIDSPAKVVLHIAPVVSFKNRSDVNLKHLKDNSFSFLQPLSSSGMSFRYNFEGLLSFWPSPVQNTSHSYLQVYKNGVLEYVDGWILKDRDEARMLIAGKPLIERVFQAMENGFKIQKELLFTGPFLIFLSILEVKGYSLWLDQMSVGIIDVYPIKNRNLIFPEVYLEGFHSNYKELFKPIFDSFYNSFGLPNCPFYDQNGAYKSK